MEDTVFTKIINGEIPSHKVYEDSDVLAIMDIAPIQPGMVVVISKQQVENLENLDEKTYAYMWSAVHKISKALRRVYPEKAKIGIMVEGLEVPHAHIKLFPFTTTEEYRNVPSASDSEADHQELKLIAEKIRSEINNGQ